MTGDLIFSNLRLICVFVSYACFLLVSTSARSKSVMPGEGSPRSTHTGFKRSMEKPLKTGWLKKQRSIVKNWQLRFFVLRGNVLTYHKDDKESAVQVGDKQAQVIQTLRFLLFLMHQFFILVLCVCVFFFFFFFPGVSNFISQITKIKLVIILTFLLLLNFDLEFGL